MLMLMFVFVFSTSALVRPEARVPFWCQGRLHGFRYAYWPVFRTERYVAYMHDRVSVKLRADFRCGPARSIECIVSDPERRRKRKCTFHIDAGESASVVAQEFSCLVVLVYF